jgi:hypothetical protein
MTCPRGCQHRPGHPRWPDQGACPVLAGRDSSQDCRGSFPPGRCRIPASHRRRNHRERSPAGRPGRGRGHPTWTRTPRRSATPAAGSSRNCRYPPPRRGTGSCWPGPGQPPGPAPWPGPLREPGTTGWAWPATSPPRASTCPRSTAAATSESAGRASIRPPPQRRRPRQRHSGS